MTARFAWIALVAGCAIGDKQFKKPEDLSPAWLVDKPRVLAIVAEPPEVAPGEIARFQALIVDPSEAPRAVVWFACEPASSSDLGFGCAIDPSIDFADATVDELIEAGLIGFEPTLPPVYTPRADLLDDLAPEDRAEGKYVTIQVAAFPADALAGAGDTDEPATGLDFNAVEVAYKRLVVSESATPNQNPALGRFVVDDLPVPADAVVQVDPSEPYELSFELPDTSVEAYTYVNTAGEAEDRVEEPYASWYASGGEVEEEATLPPYWASTWIAPESGEGTWWVVVRDRRGGMAWRAQPWAVR
jgi:hypothetical protein